MPSVGISIPVVDSADCSGATPLTRTAAARDVCTPPAVTALIGHNPGVFTPLLRTHPGDSVVYEPASGGSQRFSIQDPSGLSPQQAAVITQDSSFRHLVLLTCAVPDGSAYRTFLATPPPAPSPTPKDFLGGLGL